MQSMITYLIAGTLATVDLRHGVFGLACARVPAVAPSPGDARFGCLSGRFIEWFLLVETDGVGTGLSYDEWCSKVSFVAPDSDSRHVM